MDPGSELGYEDRARTEGFTSFRTAVSIPLMIDAIAITPDAITTPMMSKRAQLLRQRIERHHQVSNMSLRTDFIVKGLRTQNSGLRR